jgi:hypothetical protein
MDEQALDKNFEVPPANLEPDYKVPIEVLKYVPRTSVAYYHFVPLRVKDGVLEVGMVDPYNIEARDALQFISSKIGLPFKIFSLPQADFDRISQSYEGLTSQVTKALGDLDLEIQAEGREEGAIGKGGSASGGEVKIVALAPTPAEVLSPLAI